MSLLQYALNLIGLARCEECGHVGSMPTDPTYQRGDPALCEPCADALDTQAPYPLTTALYDALDGLIFVDAQTGETMHCHFTGPLTIEQWRAWLACWQQEGDLS